MPRRSRDSDDEAPVDQKRSRASPVTVKPDLEELKDGTKPAEQVTDGVYLQGGSTGVAVERNEEGDQYFKLNDYRRVTVRTFKGKVLVDIRETYRDKSTGQVKPGAKGIALTQEQWDLIKANTSRVDDMIAAVPG
ncbi:hypothetical protein IAU60_004231 [Kwoniella sp. DSM 27419]